MYRGNIRLDVTLKFKLKGDYRYLVLNFHKVGVRKKKHFYLEAAEVDIFGLLAHKMSQVPKILNLTLPIIQFDSVVCWTLVNMRGLQTALLCNAVFRLLRLDKASPEPQSTLYNFYHRLSSTP